MAAFTFWKHNKNMPEFNHLKAFVTIARESNLTRSAGLLHLSQSAISKQIRLLEDEFGFELFTRMNRGMKLTDKGRVLLPYAEGALDALGRIQKKVESLNNTFGGFITIGLNTDARFLKAGPINQQLADRYPSLNVIYTTSYSVLTAELLAHGKIDIGFLYGGDPGPGIECEKIADVKFFTVIPRHFLEDIPVLTHRAVSGLPWIWVKEDCPFFPVLSEMAAHQSVKPVHTLTAVDESIVQELVKDGQGVAIIREDEARALVRQDKAVIWDEGTHTLPLHISWLRSNSDHPRIMAVVQIICELFRVK